MDAKSWEKLRMVIVKIERRFDTLRRSQHEFEDRLTIEFKKQKLDIERHKVPVLINLTSSILESQFSTS